MYTTKLTDVKIIEPAVFGDHRGFFTESYSAVDFEEAELLPMTLFKITILYRHNQAFYVSHFQKGEASSNKIDSCSDWVWSGM
ncbi:MAG: dTDP-4-dehydrorhamnose 3,5-epimerase family protein [Enterococcus casseliflavus]